MTYNETSDAVVAARIRELLKHPACETRLDATVTVYGHILTWRTTIGAVHHGVIVNTADWERYCEIVSRVLALRNRKAAGISKPGATVHISSTGRH